MYRSIREFVCIVHLGKLQDTGVGKSKKNAKRAAAFNMLKKLEQEAAKLDEADAAGQQNMTLFNLKSTTQSNHKTIQPQYNIMIQSNHDTTL